MIIGVYPKSWAPS